jgi:dienelactone hydrolase
MRRIIRSVVAGVALLALIPAGVRAELKTETIAYRIGDKEFTGYLAYDDAIAGKRPAVIVVHEVWGQTDYIRKRAEMLAKLGYTGFALDMYGGGQVADHPDTAMTFRKAVMSEMSEAVNRFDAAKAVLLKQPTVDPEKIAAIGYCMGGTVVLHMARQGSDLDGVVSYHGGLATQTPAPAGAVKAKVLVFTGEADPMVPADQVQAFVGEMQAAGVDYTLVGFPGAKHAFTNPEATDMGQRFNMPLAYDKAADEESWAQTKLFFEQIFGH